ncbi:hypothetical protein JCM10908_003647 [Rhodotorula pacifica]|uniref:uncharacterized protein n=1 Tax=Rhodotorula pacifica TaxID=1495444 RepID=UPI00317F859E
MMHEQALQHRADCHARRGADDFSVDYSYHLLPTVPSPTSPARPASSRDLVEDEQKSDDLNSAALTSSSSVGTGGTALFPLPMPRLRIKSLAVVCCALSLLAVALSFLVVALFASTSKAIPRQALSQVWSVTHADSNQTRVISEGTGGGKSEQDRGEFRDLNDNHTATTIPAPVPLPNPLARVERRPNISLKTYLSARFDLDKDTIMWTMATLSYVPSTKGWDRKRAELGLPDSVVVLCLDHECLDACESLGLYALAAYVKDIVTIPPPSLVRRGLRKRAGAERGHTMAYLKFRAMSDMAQTGYFWLFFEGDTFLTTNPFDHMLPKEQDTWDLQFTEDGNYLLNFGWIFARPSLAAADLFMRALSEYISQNMWDQELMSNLVRRISTETGGVFEPPHWWRSQENGLRVYMLPLLEFFPHHLDTYILPDNVPEPVVHHLSSFSLANRLFYPKERGWATDFNGFYSMPRPFLRATPIKADIHQVAHYARLLHVLAVQTGWSLQVPPHMTATGYDEVTATSDAANWEYTRPWSRFISVEAAMTHGLDLVEADFFKHARQYLPDSELRSWQDRNVTVDLSQFASLDQLVSHLGSLEIPRSQGYVVEVVGYTSSGSVASTWNLQSPSVQHLPEVWRTVPICERFHMPNIPAEWCTPLDPKWA